MGGRKQILLVRIPSFSPGLKRHFPLGHAAVKFCITFNPINSLPLVTINQIDKGSEVSSYQMLVYHLIEN